jgi:hypothetical protein
MLRRLTLLAALFALLALASTAQAASIWTPVTSGTTDTISAIVYQSPTRFWYATTNGHIEWWNGSAFVAGTGGIPAGEQFTDLAFQPTSVPGGPGTANLWGYAVASNGDVWRSPDGGVSWSQLGALNTDTSCTDATSTPVAELNAVVWASPTTAYLLGNDNTLEKSTAANTGAPAFAEINKNGTTCRAQGNTSSDNLTDATFLPTSPLAGVMVTQNFGALYGTADGFTSGTRITDGTVNNFTGNPRIARDAGNPNRIWVADHEAGGNGCGELCLMVSTDGGTNSTHVTFANDSSPVGGLYDVSSQGGVEVAAGTSGEIFTSNDGTNFYNQPADGALATENWRSEGAFDAAHAAVGGENGALVVTGAANTIPDIIAPTGTISGPTTVTSGKATTYTAVLADNTGGSGINSASITWTAPGFPAQSGPTARFTFPRGAGTVTLTLTFADNAGNQGTTTLSVTVNNAPPPGPPSGSKPTTTSTGGATIKIFRVVTVTGRNARFVPVIVSASKPRKFTAQIVPAKGKKQKALATGRLTLKHEHGGHGTLRVKLPAKVKPGTYVIVVHETTLKGKKVGKVIKIKFTLR